jgi:hypothetical protein
MRKLSLPIEAHSKRNSNVEDGGKKKIDAERPRENRGQRAEKLSRATTGREKQKARGRSRKPLEERKSAAQAKRRKLQS